MSPVLKGASLIPVRPAATHSIPLSTPLLIPMRTKSWLTIFARVYPSNLAHDVKWKYSLVIYKCLGNDRGSRKTDLNIVLLKNGYAINGDTTLTPPKN